MKGIAPSNYYQDCYLEFNFKETMATQQQGLCTYQGMCKLLMIGILLYVYRIPYTQYN